MNINFSIGEGLPDILLDISQEKILKGNPEDSVEVYLDSLHGITREKVIEILSGRCSLKVDVKNQTVNYIELPPTSGYFVQWNSWVDNKIIELKDSMEFRIKCREEFEKVCDLPIDTFSLPHLSMKIYGEVLGSCDLASKIISGDKNSTEEKVWEELVWRVETDRGSEYQRTLYWVVSYVNVTKHIYELYINFCNSYLWLVKEGLVSKYPFIEEIIEVILDILFKFSDTKEGYYDLPKLYEYKNEMARNLISTSWGKEYDSYGILLKNPEDGYDAAWLSPEGEFYGENGETSSLIHLRISEKLLEKKYLEPIKKDGMTSNPEWWLQKKGWIKIHHDEIYGYDICPTDIQVSIICKYVDKFYGGKFYSIPKIIKKSEPVSTYKLRQMDKLMLRNVFGRA